LDPGAEQQQQQDDELDGSSSTLVELSTQQLQQDKHELFPWSFAFSPVATLINAFWIMP
jgi:hypothetical protein